MYLYRDDSSSTSLGEGVGVEEESNKKYIERRAYSQNSNVLTQMLLRTFFCNSISIPSWFLMKLWPYYSKQQKDYIQENKEHILGCPTSVSEITI